MSRRVEQGSGKAEQQATARRARRLVSRRRRVTAGCAEPLPTAFGEDDLLARYLWEIGRIPRFTPPAEANLFRTLAEGGPDERREARGRLIAANLRLVVSIARHYVGLGLALPELIAEGNLGLVAAVDRFEPARGHRFSTFAYWPIRKAITRALDDRGRLVRLPANSWIALRALREAEQLLPAGLVRGPSSAELAAACGVALWRFDALRPRPPRWMHRARRAPIPRRAP